MNKFFSLLAAMSIVLSSNAQTGGKISGSIKDGGNQKIIDAKLNVDDVNHVISVLLLGPLLLKFIAVPPAIVALLSGGIML